LSQEERRGRMPSDCGIHSQPAPGHSRNSQPQNARQIPPSSPDAPYPQYPTSFRYPISPSSSYQTIPFLSTLVPHYSGVSYATSTSGEVHQMLAWPGSSAAVSKIPTCLVYDPLGHIRAWGVEAKDISLKKDGFKLWLDPISAPRAIVASRFLQNVVDVVADYLSCVWMHTKNQMHRENGWCSLSTLCVPSSWGLRASLLLREAATKAGLVEKSDPEDIYWQERLHIIPETEASVIHSISAGPCLTICDAGAAAVDLATYSAAPRSGSYCGSLFLDLRFRELVQIRLATHPAHLDEASLAHFVRSFSESAKLAYKGPEDDTKLFRFRCLHVEDLHDPAVGLDHGELVIPGAVLRCEVFDPVVDQVLHSIASHVRASNVRLDALILVGGFSRNEYLFQRITGQFASSIVSVIRPAHGDIASCRGGARFSIRSLISSVIPSAEYRTMRPAYITGVPDRSLCEHRVEYIVRRGASITKGSRSELELIALNYSDHTFELVLYTSDGDQTWRYFDQEQGEELGRCRVDLGTYPGFLEQVKASPFGSFYVDFVLGFEMDSAEIRCVLLYEGVKCGSVTCDTHNYRTSAWMVTRG
ncbi:hypothetical protein BS47DRAFT_1348130, partial [Hydnum rufescens UP504]